jgi:pimeloyl-ACP methyl ester carboxylesterase
MPTLDLPDGRTLAYEVGGASDGTPVLYQHGTGDSRLARHPDDSLAASLGVRLITADRPGVGGSSRHRHRGLLAWVPDVEALADALGLHRFVVAGHSGGGPHALAIAHQLGDRVTKVGLAAPLAPLDEPGSWHLVKDRELRTIFALAHVKFLANAAGQIEARRYARDIPGFVAHCADAYPADRSVFLDPQLEPMFEEQFAAALGQDGVGALDDMWAFVDWGFAPEDVPQHVELFYGDQDDVLDVEMRDLLSLRLPDCSPHTWRGAGHYSVYAHWEEFLRSLM